MRHRNKKKILDRKKASRTALLKHLMEDVIMHEKITTTEARAKVVRPFLERLITRARDPKLANIRYVQSRLITKKAVTKLIKEIGPKYVGRNGGYTRIIKMGFRKGDGAETAVIELV